MTERKATTAQQYAALKDDRPDELVDMPSGATFVMRRVNMDSLVILGAFPQSLLTSGMKAWKEQGKLSDEMLEDAAEQAAENVDPEEAAKSLIGIREIVRGNVLEPQIGYNEAGMVSLLDQNGAPVTPLQEQDFWHAFYWITGQEGYSDQLERFRPRRERRASQSRARRSKPGNTAQRVPEHQVSS